MGPLGAEIKVPFTAMPELSKIISVGVDQNTALHASSTAMNSNFYLVSLLNLIFYHSQHKVMTVMNTVLVHYLCDLIKHVFPDITFVLG